MFEKETEDNTESQWWVMGAGAVAIVLLVPIAAVVLGVWLAVNSLTRLRIAIPLIVGGVFAAVSGIFASVGVLSVDSYFSGYSAVMDALRNQGDLGAAIWGVIASQWAIALSLGSFAGGGFIWWKRRGDEKVSAAAKGKDSTPTFMRRRAYKKTVQAIERGADSPTGGTTLGVSASPEPVDSERGVIRYGDRVVISDNEMSGHVLVVGGSGSGKTQSMLVNMRDAIRLGRGVVVIDCKGGPDVPEMLAEWAERYDRDFLHWSITDPGTYRGPADAPAFYDPISRGDPSRRKDLLIGAHKWDVEYYKSVIANYLQTAFRVMELVPALPGVDTFTDIADLLSPSLLVRRARHISAMEHPHLTSDLTRLTDMDRQELSGIRSMYARIHTLISSTAGAWLRRDPQGLRDINLRRVADEGQVVVFSLDTSNYEETATLLAGLIIQDLKTLSSELRNIPAPTPMHVYVDEFSAVDSTNILGLLSKARDARMPVMLATQALADLQRSEPTFVDQVLGIVSSFIVHRANTAEDARTFAGLSGMRMKDEARVRAGDISEEFTISVGRFQQLERGRCIYIAKNPVSRVIDYVQVIPESAMVPPQLRDPAVEVEHRYVSAFAEEEPRRTYPHPDSPTEQPRSVPVSPVPVVREPSVSASADTAPRPVRPGLVDTQAVQLPPKNTAVQGKPAGSPIPGVETSE